MKEKNQNLLDVSSSPPENSNNYREFAPVSRPSRFLAEQCRTWQWILKVNAKPEALVFVVKNRNICENWALKLQGKIK